MGIIKDGSISGNLPSSSDAFAVNYPGYPSSIECAVETLGGIEGIVKVVSLCIECDHVNLFMCAFVVYSVICHMSCIHIFL